jgi:hypothetical protein
LRQNRGAAMKQKKKKLTLSVLNVTLTASLGSAEITICIERLRQACVQASLSNVVVSKPGAGPSKNLRFTTSEGTESDPPVASDRSIDVPQISGCAVARFSQLWALVVMGEVHGDSTFAGSTSSSPVWGAFHN